MNESEPRVVAYLAASIPSRSETFVYREIRALRERGFTVHVASLRAPKLEVGDRLDDLVEGGIEVYGDDFWRRAIAAAAAAPLRAMRTMLTGVVDALAPGEQTAVRDRLKVLVQSLAGVVLGRDLAARGVRHLHCHFAHAPASVGMYAARYMGRSFSFTGHANDLFQRRCLLLRKLQRAAFVSCISEWHRELYVAIEPGVATRAEIVRCGVDHRAFQPVDRQEPSRARELRLLSVCRLVEKKGVHDLVAALARLERPASLTIAGDGPERARLEALADELGCATRVRFLGGIANEVLPKLLAEADVFVLPCRTDASGDRDGIPVVFMEAMASGLPVVSGDLPAIRELVRHGDNGLLVPEGDVNALAATLEALEPDLVRRLTANARQTVVDEFSLDETAKRLERIFERLLA